MEPTMTMHMHDHEEANSQHGDSADSNSDMAEGKENIQTIFSYKADADEESKTEEVENAE